MSEPKKVSFHTLGCKLNYSESSTLARCFEQGGYIRVAAGRDADICIINSCSVTSNADKKCRTLVRKLVRENPNAIIAVTGCYAQLKPADLASIEGVDLVVGNDRKERLPQLVAALGGKGNAVVSGCDAGELTNFFASFSTNDRTRSFLKVQDGCSYKCSYCTIPYARGESRNIPISDIVDKARQIASTGQKEIVITGINTGDFGHTTGEKFIDLLLKLNEVDGIERYRISSIEPNLLTDEIISLTSESEKFQPHFHVPLQSGSDRVLAMMRRRYTTATFVERIAAVRRAIPNVFIGIDVIVGFPSESDADFETTYSFLESLAPSFLHVFPYSEREGTPAASFVDKVNPKVSAERVRRLTDLSNMLHRSFYEKYLGDQMDVLFESSVKGGKMFGFTSNYIRVTAPYDRSRINTVCRVLLESIHPSGDMCGEILDSF